MAVGAAIAGLQAAGVQVIVSFSVPLFTAIAEASAAGLNYHPAVRGEQRRIGSADTRRDPHRWIARQEALPAALIARHDQ